MVEPLGINGKTDKPCTILVEEGWTGEPSDEECDTQDVEVVEQHGVSILKKGKKGSNLGQQETPSREGAGGNKGNVPVRFFSHKTDSADESHRKKKKRCLTSGKFKKRTTSLISILALVGLALLTLWTDFTGKKTPNASKIFKIESAQQGRCVDGSAPGFWYRPAEGGYETKWLVLLESGGQCFSEASCNDRSLYMRSSTTMGRRDFHGSMDSTVEDTELAKGNIVFVHYCSSDGWHGDAETPFPSSPNLQHFRGVRVIDEVFQSLMGMDTSDRPHDLPLLETWHSVTFAGISAGARGVLVNCDRVEKRFNFTNFGVISDSGYYIHNSDSNQLVHQTKGVYRYFVQGSRAEEENEVDSWKDLYGEYRAPKLQSRVLLIASQFDTYQQHFLPIKELAKRTYSSLSKLKFKNPCSIAFSQAQLSHATMHEASFFRQQARNVGLHDTLNEFVRQIGKTCPRRETKFLESTGENCANEDFKCEPIG